MKSKSILNENTILVPLPRFWQIEQRKFKIRVIS